MAEIDMLAYGKKKGRPSKAMKNMPKYDDNFDANARRKGVTNKNFTKAEVDRLINDKVSLDRLIKTRAEIDDIIEEQAGIKRSRAELRAKQDMMTREDWVSKQKSSPKMKANYGVITDTQYPDAGLKYGNESTGRTYNARPPRMVADPVFKQDIGGKYAVNTSGSDALSNMVGKSKAGVPVERIPDVMSNETFKAGNVKNKLPAIPTAAEQALATTASNLDNAKNVSKLDKLKSLGGKVTKGAGGVAGGFVRGYGGYDVGSRLAGGLAGLFTDDEDIKNIASAAGGIAGGAAATMVPALRLPALVYGGVKGAADVYDMLKEPSKADQVVTDEVAMQQAAQAQPSVQDMLIAELLAGKSGKGEKSKSDDALATMLALANQGTVEADARIKRLRAMDEAGLLDVDILK